MQTVKNVKQPPAAPSSRYGRGPHNGKERKRDLAIVALLSTNTLDEAAAQCGIGSRTLRTWRTQPKFIEAYRRARQELVAAATGKLRNAMTGAVDVLVRIAHDADAPTAARVTAASRILELSFHAHEIEDLVTRMEQLEEIMSKQMTEDGR